MAAYQVFISYKQSDEQGEPTRDSLLAEGIHRYLSERGVRVFFAPVALEGLGVADYGQAIGEALDQAQILVVVGTSAKNISSGWVRSEWNSFRIELVSGRKQGGRIFTYVEDVPIGSLPYFLREYTVVDHSEKEALGRLWNYVRNALRLDEQAETVRPAEPVPADTAAQEEEARQSRENTRGFIRHWLPRAAALLAGLAAVTGLIELGLNVIPDWLENWRATQTAQAPTQPIHSVALLPTARSASDLTAAPPCTEIGQIWTSLVDGMTLVCVPAGEFEMGSEELDDEKPIHSVYLDGFWIDQTEVTVAMFKQFITRTTYQTGADAQGWGYVYDSASGDWKKVTGANWQYPRGIGEGEQIGDHPVVQVSWNDALAYCEWAGRRLPTEAEWEKAARGTDGRMYPWGNQPVAENRLNLADVNTNFDWSDEKVNDGYEYTAPVGSYPAGASPYDALDMAGNVWEWVTDWFGANYYAASPNRSPVGPNTGEYRGLRGGSWYEDGYGTRSPNRGKSDPARVSDGSGFRCALAVSQSLAQATPAASPVPSDTPPPASGPPCAEIGQIWTSPADGMTLMCVPAGGFEMGSEDGGDDEKPIHGIYLDAYWIDQTEVTNAMYKRCESAGACPLPSNSSSAMRSSYYGDAVFADYPVVYINWNQAQAYCEWAGRELPTEAQWEKAARGTDGRTYPWGEGIDCQRANHVGCVGDTAEVGSFPSGASPFGALDMAGNVWEWAADVYGEDYYSNSPTRNPAGPGTGTSRVLRGGSWTNYLTFDVEAAGRESGDPLSAHNAVGFRCALAVSQSLAQTNPPASGPPCTEIQTLVPAHGSARVCVPAGEFTMGSTDAVVEALNASCPECNRRFSNEVPQHKVYLDAYWIDQTEVTNARYGECVAAGACQPPVNPASRTIADYYGNPTYADYPAIYVDRSRAQTYCQWAGGGLPTEAQWEKAARGTDGRTYPWGEGIQCGQANTAGCFEDVTPVSQFLQGSSPYGALNMAGNVWEWVADAYQQNYYLISPGRNPTGPPSGDSGIMRGGSFTWDVWAARTTMRNDNDHDDAQDNIGFRCAYPASQAPAPAASLVPGDATPPACAAIGQAYISPIDGMALACVPAGEFKMGSADNDLDRILGSDTFYKERFVAELPQHTVYLDAYWIDQTEVTNAMYEKCVAAGACQPPTGFGSNTRESYYGNPSFADHPVIYVDWNQAQIYCQWSRRELPTEAQWEKAARGTDGRLYPWGDEIDARKANYERSDGDTTAVGSYPEGASPYNTLDMAGNLREWVMDWFDEEYYKNSPGNNPTGPPSGKDRVLRNGSWNFADIYIHSAYRMGYNPTIGSDQIGFRCALTP